jgi:putative toxin-antitoxin system antitoxin component (TIGR02293 family)
MIADAATRAGIPISKANDLMQEWNIPMRRFAELLGLSDRHWRRVARTDGVLGMIESDRMVRLQKILNEVSDVFDDPESCQNWLTTPVAALAGRTPLSMLDTDAGIEGVRTMLIRIEHGIFS